MTRNTSFLALVLALGIAPNAQAQLNAHELVTWSFDVSAIEEQSIAPSDKAASTAGDLVELTATARIADAWKMYGAGTTYPPVAVDLEIASLPDGMAQEGRFRQDDPKVAFDKNFQKNVEYFTEIVRLYAQFRVSSLDANAPDSIRGRITYQICNDDIGICLPPTRQPFAIAARAVADCFSGEAAADADCEVQPLDLGKLPPLESEGGAPGITEQEDAGTPAVPQVADSLPPAGESTKTGLGFLLLALGAGFGALLTPCVFPMIPLTVSYFTKHSGSHGEAVRMASVFGVSIVLTFTGLGVIMALLVGAAGAQTIAANPWVNLLIAGVLIGFALSLFGLYELRLPSGLVNFFNRQGNDQPGYLGVLFMGFTLTLVSFSCTAPFVGGLLAATAGGTWKMPLVGMVFFSGAFALPFVFLAMFPRALTTLPSSGAWMNAVKVTLGFIELAAAIKFLSNADLVWGWNLISRPLAISVTSVIFFMTGLYLLGKLPLKHEEVPVAVGVPRLMSSIFFFGLALYLIPGLFGAPLNALDAYLPPRQGTDVSLLSAATTGDRGPFTIAGETWITDDIETATNEARVVGKPVFVDFTGYTCTNCRQMETNVFPVARVAERLRERFVLLRLHTDDLELGERFQKYQLKLTGTVALPTYAIIDPADGTLISKVSGTQSTDAFVRFLDQGTAGYERAIAMR